MLRGFRVYRACKVTVGIRVYRVYNRTYRVLGFRVEGIRVWG